MFHPQLKEVKGRTDNDFLLVAIRSKMDDYNPPYIFHTNDRIQHYVETVTKTTLPDFAVKLEAHVISGVDGTSAHLVPFMLLLTLTQVSSATPAKRRSSSSARLRT